MKWFLWIFGFFVWLGACLLIARFLAFNRICWEWDRAKRADRRSGRDRRQRQAPIAMERRKLLDRRRFVLLSQRGATVPIVAIVMAGVMLPMMALTLGVGQMAVDKAEAQNAADAAALAASNAFYDPVEGLQPEFVYVARAANAGDEVAAANGGACTVELGHWNPMGNNFVMAATPAVPVWDEVTVEEVYVDPAFANAARVRCTYTGATIFLGWPFGGGALATAFKRVEAVGTGGVQLMRGSVLCQ